MATRFIDTRTGNHTSLVTDSHVSAALLMLARLTFGGFFAYSGVNHLVHRAMLAGAAATRGVPLPDLAVIGTGLLLVAGSMSVLTGVLPKVGCAFLAIFLIGVTPIMHAFWTDTDPVQHAADLGNFMKNVALLGALGFVASVPEPWPGSPHGSDIDS